MTAVADASPIIFLCKIGQLYLIPAFFRTAILLPGMVYDEILADPVPADEAIMIGQFVEKHCRIVRAAAPQRVSSSLSADDHSVLALAVSRKADYVLCDDLVLRKMVAVQKMRTMGTMGMLAMAVDGGVLSRAKAWRLFRELIEKHGFRISLSLYDRMHGLLRS